MGRPSQTENEVLSSVTVCRNCLLLNKGGHVSLLSGSLGMAVDKLGSCDLDIAYNPMKELSQRL